VEPAVYTPVSAATNLRRSSVIAAFLGGLATIALSIAGHPFMGLFVCLGLALGAVNNRLLQLSVIKYATANGEITKGRFRGGVMGRLGTITIIAIIIALIDRPDGLGVFAGLAAFQVLMLVGAALPIFRSLRPTS
jgi:ATP synthase I chain